MPFRKSDVSAIAENSWRERRGGEPRQNFAEDFLKEVSRVGAEHFANRPITLRFLLDAFRKGNGLPCRRAFDATTLVQP